MSPAFAEPNIGLFSAILLVGVAQGLFLGIAILAAPRRADRANLFLAALVFTFVLELLSRFAINTGYIALFPQALSLHWALDVFYGPLIFSYVHHLTRSPDVTHSDRTPWHFALPVLSVPLAMFLWVPFSRTDFLNVMYSSAPVPLEIAEASLASVGLISMITYLVWSFRVLRRHRQRIQTNYSYAEKIGLAWLRNLLAAMATLLVLYVSLTVSGWYIDLFDKLYAVSMVVAVFGIGFLGIRQPAVFVRRKEGSAEFLPEPVSNSSAQETKYRKSALAESEIASIYAAINELMDAEKTYLQNDLSLPRLADQLGLPSHYVSQAINQGSGSNFFDFVNGRRVAHVADLLTTAAGTRSDNVLRMAMDAGFNSKSAFYTAFRKQTGMSPKQFQKAIASAPS